MEIVTDASSRHVGPEGSVVTIGAYDGLHRGHRHVISLVREMAAEGGHDSAVVTFDRHPASIVRPRSAPRLLTDLAQKLELLESTGIDRTLVVHFDTAQAEESAESFVTGTLVDRLGARVVVVGEDFHFGNGRRGDVALLEKMGADIGFSVVGVGLVGLDGDSSGQETGAKVSSTAIRIALEAGELGRANEMLGRHHEVRGQVMGGDRRGRELGFPTANVAVPNDVCLPGDGIYAGWYERPDGEVWPTAISLGRRPTFYEEAHQSLLEAHLLDFTGDLYGEPARVRFVSRLRGEIKFDDVDDLIAQIVRDCAEARRLLGSEPGAG